MVKCEIKGCKKYASLIHQEKNYCATHYIEYFMKYAHKNNNLKNRIAGQLCQQNKQPK
tara:strand:+ start:405 stop:578 length:174 start_codon:yes stop_codon:yes gene_type:complete